MTALDIRPGEAIFINAVADSLAPPIDPMSADPVGWIKEKGAWVVSYQGEIAESVRDNRFTAVRSCHGSGKSFIAAWIACWWLATHDDAMVVTSAPSAHQVQNILWKEIRRAHKAAGLAGHITHGQVPEWKDESGEVIAFGRKPADYVDPDEARTRFQGIHATHVLVILDEGSGIPDWLAGAAEDLSTNENSRVLIIGNPTNPASYFAKVSQPASLYHRIRISAWDLPAYTGEYIPPEVAAKMTGKLWVEERRQSWGEGSLFWVAKVEAEFPHVAEDVLFTPAVLALGVLTDLSSSGATKYRGVGGLDVARFGDDETVLYINKRGYVRLKGRWGKLDTMETVGKITSMYPTDNPGAAPFIWVDTTGGLGAGPYDRLKELDYPVGEINYGSKAIRRPHKFKNRRAEMYWDAKEQMESGRIDIDALDEELQRELLEHRFKENSTGLIQIEAKEDVTKRLGHSPDRADAFVQCLQKGTDWAKALGVDESSTNVAINPDRQPREESPEDIVRDIMEVPL